MTAALPMSFARLARRWFSNETRSTAASTAELSSSAMRTRNRQPTSSARSRPLWPSQRPIGAAAAKTISSCRNASSWRAAADRPSREYRVAFRRR
jgi:hypothetical protein